jgi:hypothetical protein
VRVIHGVTGAIGRHPRVFLAVFIAVVTLSVLGPPAVLSVARRPVDYFTFNPWLRRLPAWLLSPAVPLGVKLEKLPDLALFWFSSDSPYGGVEWGFAVDVTDLGRIVLLAGLFGAYFALLARRREEGSAGGAGRSASRRGGVAGMLASVVGLSTGPCSVMGCGAPVIPVVGLAFAGLSSGTLSLLAGLSRVVATLVLVGLGAAVLYLAWRTGEARRPPAGGRRVPAALALALLALGIPPPTAEACGPAPAALASTVRDLAVGVLVGSPRLRALSAGGQHEHGETGADDRAEPGAGRLPHGPASPSPGVTLEGCA